ncbi:MULTISPECIES: DUF3110 domain-containing protein [unclassified Roseofilum]|uniref:DUF3110 domain-containing protein n=1 Tax=unclassified Roseofilum TaxID=2620099 RepID=UPI001B06F646|nr:MULTISPECIES: DUF3110 domain-containing protein [unclassified Roseofilum]MBP0007557.1 DUF3110 domain-containing protein [Roseofilum sp. Belize Diploria]MBP0024382.1 DUF3110 domain-containing protein [Roseofilum sp. SID2]MBP0033961.1 DUF3110 domain-containing protein [Roseofilum sp. Belize BBD 4]MBP0039722.1 DUF3110 domain-containing protein [Roseofilum sp. SID1]MBP0044924.1 DUF3110 domain-containing protein [Roseofilum sp. SBFL]
MRVYVLLFNVGTENEGIHTIKVPHTNPRQVRNKVLVFEVEDDATRFALQLEAQDFPSPSVEAIDEDEIKAFCEEADLDFEWVSEGKLVIPPESNVDSLDWSEEEPDVPSAEESESEMSSEELDRIRRSLEGLL